MIQSIKRIGWQVGRGAIASLGKNKRLRLMLLD